MQQKNPHLWTDFHAEMVNERRQCKKRRVRDRWQLFNSSHVLANDHQEQAARLDLDLRECSPPDSAITNTPLLSRALYKPCYGLLCAPHLIFNNPHSWTRLIQWPEVVKHSSNRQPAPIYMKDWEEGRKRFLLK